MRDASWLRMMSLIQSFSLSQVIIASRKTV